MKRCFDFAAALVLLVLLAPVFLVVAGFVRWRLGSPILFRQWRPGKNGNLFPLIKFRSMRDANDESGQPLPDAIRLTPFGRFLRGTSLDELPELWNVLRGEMSLVGPRPLLPAYLELYSPEQARRHEVWPGITGWAQVNGRNALSWEEKFALDVWYVDHQSFLLDLRILVMTLWQVIARRGISEMGQATAAPFAGTPRPPGDTEHGIKD